MPPRLISERVQVEEFAGGSLSRGEPLAPVRLRWRERLVEIAEVVESWRKTTSDGYVRRHYFHLRTSDGAQLIVYCERQPRSPARPGDRWFLYTIEEPS